MDCDAVMAMWARGDQNFGTALRRFEIAARSHKCTYDPRFVEITQMLINLLCGEKQDLKLIVIDLLRDFVLMDDARYWNNMCAAGLMNYFEEVSRSLIAKREAVNWLAFAQTLMTHFRDKTDIILHLVPLLEYANDPNTHPVLMRIVEGIAFESHLNEQSQAHLLSLIERISNIVEQKNLLSFIHLVSRLAKESVLSNRLGNIAESLSSLYFRASDDPDAVLYFSVLVTYLAKSKSENIHRVIADLVLKALNGEFEVNKAFDCYCRVLRHSESQVLINMSPSIFEWILENVDVFGSSEVISLTTLVETLSFVPETTIHTHLERLLRFMSGMTSVDSVECSSCILTACAIIFDAENKLGSQMEAIPDFIRANTDWFVSVLECQDEQLKHLALQVRQLIFRQ